jgi:hypothetical protein
MQQRRFSEIECIPAPMEISRVLGHYSRDEKVLTLAAAIQNSQSYRPPI